MDPKVYDAIYAVENGRMVMQTDLDLNGHKVRDAFSVEVGRIKMQKNLDLNGHRMLN